MAANEQQSEKGQPPELSSPAYAFDQAASRYDQTIASVEIAVWFRRLVWKRMETLFLPGMRVLELGCGTGEDAIWNAQRGVHVTATDGSPAMCAITRDKAAAAGVGHLIDVQPLDFFEAARWTFEAGTFDGVYSNYGALNCIGDWRTIGSALSKSVRPGGVAGLCLIGRICPWEIGWHAAHGHFKTALRRLPGHALARLDGNSFSVYYPTVARLTRDFGVGWQRRRTAGVGVWLPPSDVYPALSRHPALARGLLRLEQTTAAWWPFRFLGDHFWLELVRR